MGQFPDLLVVGVPEFTYSGTTTHRDAVHVTKWSSCAPTRTTWRRRGSGREPSSRPSCPWSQSSPLLVLQRNLREGNVTLVSDTTNPIPEVFRVEPDQAALLTHLKNHDTHMGGQASEACAHCASALLLRDLHEAWTTDTEAHDLLWSMQDGYGEVGYTPPQGHDWSGVRDSKPSTIYLMHQALLALDAGPEIDNDQAIAAAQAADKTTFGALSIGDEFVFSDVADGWISDPQNPKPGRTLHVKVSASRWKRVDNGLAGTIGRRSAKVWPTGRSFPLGVTA